VKIDFKVILVLYFIGLLLTVTLLLVGLHFPSGLLSEKIKQYFDNQHS